MSSEHDIRAVQVRVAENYVAAATAFSALVHRLIPLVGMLGEQFSDTVPSMIVDTQSQRLERACFHLREVCRLVERELNAKTD